MLNKTRIKKITIYTILFTCLFISYCYITVEFNSRGKVYNSTDNTPPNKVALVLGTSQYLKKGVKNPYFTYRIDAAVQLYNAGKASYFLVSGDNRILNYNEPERMRRELIKRGIPNDKIILDYAGFRTLDSVVRCKKVFGQSDITIVSQPFHNKRALFIADFYEMNAIAFNANDVPLKAGIKTNIREVFARVKMILDLYILKKQPHFLGEPIHIPS